MDQIPPRHPRLGRRCHGCQETHLVIACLSIVFITLFTLFGLVLLRVPLFPGDNVANPGNTTVTDINDIILMLNGGVDGVQEQMVRDHGEIDGVGRRWRKEVHEVVHEPMLEDARQRASEQAEREVEGEAEAEAEAEITKSPVGRRAKGMRKRRGVIHTHGVVQPRVLPGTAD